MPELAGKRCPECGSTQVYYKVKTQEYQCQKCGYCGKIEGSPNE